MGLNLNQPCKYSLWSIYMESWPSLWEQLSAWAMEVSLAILSQRFQWLEDDLAQVIGASHCDTDRARKLLLLCSESYKHSLAWESRGRKGRWCSWRRQCLTSRNYCLWSRAFSRVCKINIVFTASFHCFTSCACVVVSPQQGQSVPRGLGYLYLRKENFGQVMVACCPVS